MPDKRNIVLLCLDTVRKDYFDELTEQIGQRSDVVYEQCRAASSWSPPSHASMFTGELPHHHGVHAPSPDFSVIDKSDTFLDDLENYRSVGISANVWASSVYDFDELFDDFVDVSPHRRFPNGLDIEEFYYETDKEGMAKYLEFLSVVLAHDHSLASLANGVAVQIENVLERAPIPKLADDGATIVSKSGARWVRSHDDSDDPFFMFANYMDAHSPHTPIKGYDASIHEAPATWSSDSFDTVQTNIDALNSGEPQVDEYEMRNERGLYSAAVDYLDSQISQFMSTIQEETDRETTFIVTADHGENLGELENNYLFGHQSSMTEGVMHVPLSLINAPGGERPPVKGLVSHLSLPDLILGISRNEVPDITADQVPAEVIGNAVGRSLGERSLEDSDYELWNRMIRAIYKNDKKWVWDSTGRNERYVLDRNRPNWQRIDDREVGTSKIEKMEGRHFDSRLKEYKRQTKSNPEASASTTTRDRLEDLGYL